MDDPPIRSDRDGGGNFDEGEKRLIEDSDVAGSGYASRRAAYDVAGNLAEDGLHQYGYGNLGNMAGVPWLLGRALDTGMAFGFFFTADAERQDVALGLGSARCSAKRRAGRRDREHGQ